MQSLPEPQRETLGQALGLHKISTKEYLLRAKDFEKAAGEHGGLNDAVAMDLRAGALGVTARERTEAMEKIKALGLDPMEGDEPFAVEARAVRDHLAETLVQGGQSKELARANADLMSHHFYSLAYSAALDETGRLKEGASGPKAFYEKLKIRFEEQANKKRPSSPKGEGAVYSTVFSQPMNAGVDLNQEVQGVVIQSRLTADEARALKRNAHKKDFARRLAGDYINRDTGWTLHLSLTNVSHAISSALIRDDVAVSFEKSMQILEGLPELLANAKLVESHKDRKGRQNIRNIHRFYASARLDDDRQTTYTVKITVKELEGKLQAQIDKIYESHDARVIKKVSDVNHAPQSLNRDFVKQNTPDTYGVILRDVLDNVKDNDGNLYFQSAWHGSPHRFESFDLGAVGSGEGGQAHGWGLYFARDKKIAEGYRAKLESEGNGALFEVDVPENDMLLDEDKLLPEQPEKVREAISKYYRSRPDDYIAVDSDSLPEQNGKLFLKEVIRQLAREGEPEPKKAASLLLNSLGIKGITYDGSRDGRCFVVFDDKAVSVIERYNQEVTGQPLVRQGLTRKPDSAQAKVVHLPEKAVPAFDRIKDFRNWALRVLIEGGDNAPVTIRSTGAQAVFTASNVRASLKRSRSETHRNAYAALREMISLAEYDHFEPADVKHPYVQGQDVYYSALSVGDRLYSVRLKLDVTPSGDNGGGSAVYKDHKLTEIEIAPALYSRTLEGVQGSTQEADAIKMAPALYGMDFNGSHTQEAGAISTVSLGVLRGNVKPSHLEDGALWQEQLRGSVEFRGDKSLITLFKAADQSTFVHEMGHVMLENLLRLGRGDDAPPMVVRDLDVALDFLNMKDFDFDRVETPAQRKRLTDAQERFARAFERYLMEGRAPSKGLKGVFARMKRWMLSVYHNARRLGVELSPQVRDLFARLLAGPAAEEGGRLTLSDLRDDAAATKACLAELNAEVSKKRSRVEVAQRKAAELDEANMPDWVPSSLIDGDLLVKSGQERSALTGAIRKLGGIDYASLKATWSRGEAQALLKRDRSLFRKGAWRSTRCCLNCATWALWCPTCRSSTTV